MWVILIEDIVRTVWDATECSAVTRKLRFESSVISYGSQTDLLDTVLPRQFESSVISYGSQTEICGRIRERLFESSVISYGSQT